MGGKTKQSQRTKNNARPSSSGRSAELLSGVKLESGMVSVGGTQLPALFPSLAAPTPDPLTSPELQLCLKKLNKKDPITKTKALQELTELVSNSKIEDVASVLPSWAHFYKILTADPDRKVRECTQACHGCIVSVCGRRVAPHLKALMPAWLQAQYDEHAPAHTHAVNSLKKTFPDNKLPEVLSFCKDEIMSNLLDVLVGNGVPAHVRMEPEERAAAAERALAGSLHALHYVTRHLPAAHHAPLYRRLAALLAHAAFWRTHAHRQHYIRAAWYGALGSVISRYKGEFATQYGAKTLRVLVDARESNPLPAAALWDCLLLFMHDVPEWHQYLENKDLLTKRILDLLESGGWGDARHLSHMLLPLLAHLPHSILTKEFHVAFFDAIFNGLDKHSIRSSKSERQCWITSLDECLRYVSVQQREYTLEIVTSVHRTWLERVLTAEGPTGNHLIKHSATTMANLVKYWLRQAKRGNGEKFDRSIRNFWQNLGSTSTTQIDKLSTNRDDIDRLIETHILLLRTLKSAFSQEVKKRHSIKFEADPRPADVEPAAESPPTDPAATERYDRNLNELVRNVCCQYFEFASRNRTASPVLSPLISLLVEFDSEGLFAAVARRFDAGSVYGLYDTVLRPWLAGDAMRCRAVADVVFMLFDYLTERERDAVFDTFERFPRCAVEWCMSLSLSHPHMERAATRRWLRGAAVADAVRALTTRLLRHGDASARALLMLCLTKDHRGEHVVSESAVNDALQRLAESLLAETPAAETPAAETPAAETPAAETPAAETPDAETPEDGDAASLEARCAVAAQLATALEPHAGLLMALLSLTARLQRGSARVCVDTWREMREAWQAGVTSLEAGPRARFLSAAADLLRREATPRNPTELNVSKIEHVVSLCPYLLCDDGRVDVDETVRFTRDLLADSRPPPASPELHATRHDVLVGNLNCPLRRENDTVRCIADGSLGELAPSEFTDYASRVVFRTLYLRTLFLNLTDEETDENYCSVLLSREFFEELFCRSVRDYAIVCALHDGYAFWPHYKTVEEVKNRLSPVFDDIVKKLDDRSDILRYLTARAASEGYYWAYARRIFEVKAAAIQIKPTDKTTADDNNDTITTESGASYSDSEDINADTSEADEMNTVDLKLTGGETEPVSDSITKNNRVIEKIADTETGKKEISETKQIVEGESNQMADSATKQSEHSETEQIADSERNQIGDSEQKQTVDSEQIQLADSEAKCTIAQVKGILDVDSLDSVTGSGFYHMLQAGVRDSPATERSLEARFLVVLRGLHCVLEAGWAAPALAPALTPAARTDLLLDTYYSYKHIMLYELDVSASPWKLVVCNAAICDYLTTSVELRGWELAANHWDFINITLCSLLTSLHMSKENWGTVRVGVLARATLRLFRAVSAFTASVATRALTRQPSAHVAALPREWDDIYAPDLQRSLVGLVLHVLECNPSPRVSSVHVAVLHGLAQCCPPLRLRAGADTLERVARACADTLRAPARVHVAYKILAYYTLQQTLEPLVLQDAEALQEWSSQAQGEEGGATTRPLRLSLEYYEPALTALQDLVEAALANVGVCEEVCGMVPFTDAHSLALGWLLLAELVNRQCGLARGDLRHHYTHMYRERKYTVPLLTGALRLLPSDVLTQAASAAGDSPAHGGVAARYTHMFLEPPQLDAYEWCGSAAVSRAACRGAWWAARGPGAPDARGWRALAPHRHKALLDNILRRYITPHIVKEEFKLLQKKAKEIEDTEITINRSAYEVSCVLTVDDSPIALTVELARQHPLVLPRLASSYPANNACVLMYLGYQNGSLLNALKMWVSSVSSKLERAPQCYICYCRLHHATGRLPQVTCHTCHNKFHSVCVRKWFSTSNKMTCPLCRTLF